MPERNPTVPGVLTVVEVARELRCSKAHVHHLVDGGAEKMGPLWQGESGQQCGYAMANCRRNGVECEGTPSSGGMVFRSFRLLGAVGLAFDFQDDRP